MSPETNTALMIVLIAAFLGIIAFLSYLGYKKTRDAKDYLLAGSSIHPVSYTHLTLPTRMAV